jgi:hypothetical protein
LLLSVATAAAMSCIGRASAATITEWNFATIGATAPPINSPAPTTGLGTAVTLGMTNAYNGGNTASDDILSTAGVPSNFTEMAWRIRGAGHNGWATNAAGAPQYSQGLELDASTVGFANIKFAFDWFSTNQGIRDLQFQYNTNTGNAGGWTNFGGTTATGTYLAMPGDWYNTSPPMISLDLSSIAGVSNDPNFGVRLVSAFDSTGNVPNDYAGATLSGGLTTIYNNNSGNWRFGVLTVSGVAVPEPSTLALTGVGSLMIGLMAWRRRSKGSR